jgi:CRISPR/Cas system endoribonuclease Cas6 (RAMP superfamily)
MNLNEKPETIAEIVQIKSKITSFDEFTFYKKLRDNLKKSSSSIHRSSPVGLYTYYNASCLSRKFVKVSEDVVMLLVDASEGQYEIEFKQTGDEIRFVYEGPQKCFMGESMKTVFDGISWDRVVTQSKMQRVQYQL